MESEISLPCSQEPTPTGPIAEPDEYSPQPHSLFQDPF